MNKPLKALHLAKSIQELNGVASKGVASDLKNVNIIKKALDTLQLAANSQVMEGDQEMAYVYAMRCMDTYMAVKKSTFLAKDDKDYLMKYFSASIHKVIDQCETLSNELGKRYKELEMNIQLMEMEKQQHDIAEKSITKVVQPTPAAQPTESNKALSSTWLSTRNLYNMIKSALSLLLMDVRPNADFQDCHIDIPKVMNIPPDVLQPGVTITKLNTYLANSTADSSFLGMWKSRGEFTDIVLLDWNSNAHSLDLAAERSSHPLHALICALTKWDSQHLVKCPIKVLSGGLREFLSLYPTCCTSTRYSGPRSSGADAAPDKSGTLNSMISYPSLVPKKVTPVPTPISSSSESSSESSTSESEESEKDKETPKPPVPPSSTALNGTNHTKPTLVVSSGPVVHVDRSTKPKVQPIPAARTLEHVAGPSMPAPIRPPKPAHLRVSNEAPASISVHKEINVPSSRPMGDMPLQELVENTADKRVAPSQAEDKAAVNSGPSSKPVSAASSGPLEPHSPVPPTPQVLNHGWLRLHDSSTNRYHYFNMITNVNTYNPPEEVIDNLREHPPRTGRPADVKSKASHTSRPTVVATTSDAHNLPTVRGGVKRSSSQPGLDRLSYAAHEGKSGVAGGAPIVAAAAIAAAIIPDRATKPSSTVASLPAPSTRQEVPAGPQKRVSTEAVARIQELTALQLRSLNPTYGSSGPGLTGLRNLGNTCYMNSVLQALCNTPLLHQYFREGHHLRDLNVQNPLGFKGRMANEFAVIMQAVWSNCYSAISPRDFKQLVDNSGYIFAGSQQQDSQEFLLFLLDGLHEDLNRVRQRPKVEPLRDEEVAKITQAQHADLAWERHLMLNRSVIVQAFQGQLKSTLTCCTCRKQSVTFDAFMYLSLPLVSSSECSLMDCLRLFLREERMTGDSRWRCPVCCQNRDAVKKIELWKLPPYLLIHLKRFTSTRQKLNTAVSFPLDELELSPFVCGPRRADKYHLYAVSNHFGRMEGGHYTAFCRNVFNRAWYLFDDERVAPTSAREVQSSAAYVLFYDTTKIRK